MQIQRLAFVAFPVSDLNRSQHFYCEILGAPLVSASDEDIDVDLGGVVIRAYVHRGEYRRQHSGLQFAVDDVDDAFVELTRSGVRTRSPVRTEPWGGRVFTISDPDGNVFDLLDASYLMQTDAPATP
jgi:catechol 2,3-dioxygenase-like lactoylglutathione lyase family enzyme